MVKFDPFLLLMLLFPFASKAQPYTPIGYDRLPLSGGGGWRVVPFDADQDGDVDLLQLRSHQSDVLFLNDGLGFFTKVEGQQSWQIPGGSFDAATADFNGDGLPDLVIGRGPASGGSALFDGHDMLLIANGDGTFWDAGDNLKSAGTATCILPLEVSKTNYSMGVAVADFDKDGRPDIAFANGGLIYQPGIRLLEPFTGQWLLCPQFRDRILRNQLFLAQPDAQPADGVYDYADVSEVSGIGMTAAMSTGVVSADFNGDGWEDLFFTTFSYAPLTGILGPDGQSCKLYLNNPSQPASFLPSSGFPAMPFPATGVAAADFDQDGDVDLLLSMDAGAQGGAALPMLFLNNGEGIFTEAPPGLLPVLPAGCMRRMYLPKFEDLNGDGWLDVFLAGIQGALFFQDSLTHTFSDVTDLLPLQGSVYQPFAFNSYGAALADYDGNGELDIFLSNTYEQPHLWLESAGEFDDLTTHNLSPDGENNSWLRAFDFDKDGDMDLVGAVDANCGMSQSIHLQTGTGANGLPIFEDASGLLPNVGEVKDKFVLAHDFDGDAREDMLFAGHSAERIFRSVGSAVYEDKTADWWPAAAGNPDVNKVVRLHLSEGNPLVYFFFATGTVGNGQNNLLMVWDNDLQKLTLQDWLPADESVCLDAAFLEDINGDSWPEIAIATQDKGTLMYLSTHPSTATDPGYVLVQPDGFLPKNSAAVIVFGAALLEFSSEQGLVQPHRYHQFLGLDATGIPLYETSAFGEPVNGTPVVAAANLEALSPFVFVVADHVNLQMYRLWPFSGIIENISEEWLDVDGGEGFGMFARGIDFADLNGDGFYEILVARDDQDLLLYDKQVVSATDETMDTKELPLMVFPNPSDGTLNIFSEEYQNGEEVNMEVWNIAGLRIFYKKDFWSERGMQLQLPGAAPSGIYFLKISSQQKVKSSRIVVK